MEVSFISSSGRRSPPASFVPVQASAVEQAATARPPLTVLGDLERSRVWRVAGDGDVTRDLAVQSRILPPAQLDPSGCTSFFLRGPPRTVIKPGYPAYYRIVKAFGHEILLENGEINRQALGSIIFHQSEKRKLLNAITHPEIRKEMLKQILKYLVQGYRYVILDIPLLFETKTMLRFMKHTVVVYCDPQTQLSRLMQRNGLSREEAEERIAAQLSLEEKRQLARHILDNSGEWEVTRRQTLHLHSQLEDSLDFLPLRLGLFAGFLGIIYLFSRHLLL